MIIGVDQSIAASLQGIRVSRTGNHLGSQGRKNGGV